MTSKEHKKHSALRKPALGYFSRNEWAILGSSCSVIKSIAAEVIKTLSKHYRCAYADTSHKDDIELKASTLFNGSYLEYTDNINHHQLNFGSNFDQFKLKEAFASADMVLINGNHQQAKAQVLIIDKNKEASLRKRIDQLINVQMILLADGAAEIFDFIQEAVPNWRQLPVYRLDESEKIIAFFERSMQEAKPVLNGLVLAGGKSIRMGFDKGAINWHGREQRYHMADLLKPSCKEVFISCRAEQKNDIDNNYISLADTFLDLGPYGAILSAFREQPDSAWLVIASDLPLMDTATLQYLIDHRNTATIATAFISAFDGLPEPLITIWEPKSYSTLLSFLAMGYSCPRKVLINSDSTLINAPNPQALTNVNTPQELEKIERLLDRKIAVT